MLVTSYKVIACTAFTNAVCYLVGFYMLSSVFLPYFNATTITSKEVFFLLEHRYLYQLWMIIIYIVFGLSLTLLVISLNKLFQTHDSLINQVAMIVGLIWASFVIASGMIAIGGIDAVYNRYSYSPDKATELWLAISTIQQSVGGNIEILGGIWILFISLIAKRNGFFTQTINYLGILSGFAGLLSLTPSLQSLGLIFGLTQLIWFIAIGLISFLKNKQSKTIP